MIIIIGRRRSYNNYCVLITTAAAILLLVGRTSLGLFAAAAAAADGTSASSSSLLAPDTDPSMPRVLVEYNNIKFVREAIEKFAVDGQIRNLIHLKHKNVSQLLQLGGNQNKILTIVINNATMMEKIMESPYVDRVALDQRMTSMVYSKKPRYVHLKQSSCNENENNDNNNDNNDDVAQQDDEEELGYLNTISTVRRKATETNKEEEEEEGQDEERTDANENGSGTEQRRKRKLRLFGKDEGERIPYGITMVQAPALWPLPQKNKFVGVCVVDTGYNAGHEDLPTVTAKQVGGTNTGAGVWFNDGHGHGTHCAGTIGAVGNNDVGVVGIREEPTLNVFHVGKGLADDGSGFSSNVMAAVQGCVDAGARVVSLSLGGTEKNRVEENFYDDVYNQGVLVVAAAGNSGNSGLLYPGGYSSVIAVSAVDAEGIRPAFSQCNKQVEIAAPGVDIMSTFPPNEYAVLSGTSMAGPHVAGIAAQLMAFFPECTNYQIRNAMVRSAAQVGEHPGLCNNGYGSGLVQGKASYDLLATQGCEGAGGPVVSNPAKEDAKGGCEQNRDYTKFGNTTYRDVCPGKQLMSSGPSSSRIPTGTAMNYYASLMTVGMIVVSTISLL